MELLVRLLWECKNRLPVGPGKEHKDGMVEYEVDNFFCWAQNSHQAEFKDVGIVGPEHDEDDNEHWHPGKYTAAAP